MYAGQIVERGAGRGSSSRTPQHPYTEGLLDSIPLLGMTQAAPLKAIRGHGAEPARLAAGAAASRPRCDYASTGCRRGACRRCSPVGARARSRVLAAASTARGRPAVDRTDGAAGARAIAPGTAAPARRRRPCSRCTRRRRSTSRSRAACCGRGRQRPGRRRRRPRDPPRRDAGPRRRVRLRQVDARPHAPAADRADGGEITLRRASTCIALAGDDAAGDAPATCRSSSRTRSARSIPRMTRRRRSSARR